MPYDPRIQYTGAASLYDAIGSLGGDAADAMKKRQEAEQQAAFAASTYQDLVNAKDSNGDPILSDDERTRFVNGNANQRNGILIAAATKIQSDWKQKAQTAQIQGEQARTALTNAQLNQTGPFARDPMEGETYYHPQTGEPIGIYGDRGQVQFYPVQASGSDESMQVDPFTDPVTGKPVQGMGIVRKTGAIGYFQPSGMERDPKTGALGVRDTRGNFKPLNAQQLAAMSMDPNNPVQQSPTPTPTPGILSRIGKALSGGNGSAPGQQSPAGAPAVTPTPFGPRPLSAQDQQALAWAQANPTDPRSAAILRRLGLTQ